MNDRASVVTETTTASGGIPLDFAPLLTPYRQHRRLSLRVVHLPARAQLSSGVKNEDASWSLTPEDLDGLALLLPDDVDPPASMAIRIVVIDKNENASIVGQFEVPLPRSETPARGKNGTGSDQALAAEWRRRMDRRAVAAQRLAGRKTALALAEAETAWRAASGAQLLRREQEWQQTRLAERAGREAAEAEAAEAAQNAATLARQLEAALARAVDAETAAARTAGSAEHQAEAIEARLAQEIEARLTQELDARVALARSDWEVESEARIAAAVEQAAEASELAAERRLEALRANWQKEAEQELAASRQGLAEAQEAARQLEARLSEATAQRQNDEQALELRWRQKVEAEHSARTATDARAEAAVEKASTLAVELEAAIARAAAAEAAVAGAGEKHEASVAEEARARLAAARAEWHRETAARVAAAEEESTRKTEAKAEARLRQARESWEREAEDALAVAEGKWRGETTRRLAAAQAEWKKSAEASAAAGRRTLRDVAQRQQKSNAWRRAGRLGLVTACVAAGFVFYTEFKPTVVGQWAPKVTALAGDAKAAVLSELRDNPLLNIGEW